MELNNVMYVWRVSISEAKLRKVYRDSEMFADRKLQILRVLADHSIKAIDDSFFPWRIIVIPIRRSL